MSIGEVIGVVESMAGGEAAGDTDALYTAISVARRLGDVLGRDFRDTGAKGLGVAACRRAGQTLGWNMTVRTERAEVGQNSMNTARGIVDATVSRQTELVQLREFAGTVSGRIQAASIRVHLEQLMNSTYTYPITDIHVATTDGLGDTDSRMVTLSSFASTQASNATSGGDAPVAQAASTPTVTDGTSPVTQPVSAPSPTTTRAEPVSMTQTADSPEQRRTTTAPGNPTTTPQSPSNTTQDITNTSDNQRHTTAGNDPDVTATRDTTSPNTTNPNSATPNTTNPNAPGPNTTVPGNRNLNLPSPLNLPGLNGTPGSPTSVPRPTIGPITTGVPRTVLSPRGVTSFSTTSGGSPTTSAVPGTSAARPLSGGAVPPGTRTAGSRDGGGGHTVASYLRTQENGQAVVGSLPLVSPPVIGDWEPDGSDCADRDGDSGPGGDNRNG